MEIVAQGVGNRLCLSTERNHSVYCAVFMPLSNN